MNYPLKAEGLKANDAKLGGKYRMSNVREFIALAYLLYLHQKEKLRWTIQTERIVQIN